MQSIESIYDDIIKKTGGFALYQKLATLICISSFALFYAQLFALNFLLLPPDYDCQVSGSTDWVSCSRSEACDSGTADYRIIYNRDKESFPNLYEQMNLSCVEHGKINMIVIAFVISNFAA